MLKKPTNQQQTSMENEDDLQKAYLQELIDEENEELAKNVDLINEFKKQISKLNISIEKVNFKFYQTTGIVAIYPNIVSHLQSSLTNDKEGLLDFKMLCQAFEKRRFAKGYLYGQYYMLMAHPYFRRGYHDINNFAPKFIDLFWDFNHPVVNTYISIDPDRVRINVDNCKYMERDTWYGAHFNKKIDNIPDGLVKLRPPGDLGNSFISFFFANSYSLDIKWSTKNNIKSFQAEEFKTGEIKIIKNGNEYYPVRYIHAEFDLTKGYFRHFDGAIHFYTIDEYQSRRDSDFNFNLKNASQIKTHSQKLFKMNGIISIETWIEFTCHFFTGNPLTFEYFEGEYPIYLKEKIQIIRQKRNSDKNL